MLDRREGQTTASFWYDRNVFITGCDGFLGSWLSQALCEAGANVIGLVRNKVAAKMPLLESGSRRQVKRIQGNVEDFETVLGIMNEHEVDTVFHLAARATVGGAFQYPLTTFETNIKGTWNVLESSRQTASVKRVIVASSDRVYGRSTELPYDESAPLLGVFPYEVSKTCAEHLCACYFHSFQLPVAVTRCSNLYGGGDWNGSRLIPGTIRSVMGGRSPVIRSDGSACRDYLYMEDAVDAYLCLAEKMEQQKLFGETFNFCTDSPISVRQLVKQILDLMRCQLEPVILNEASNEIKKMALTARKARTLLGWRPKHTLEQGLIKTIAWYSKAPEKEKG
ncbi:GDP-mannose 4,6-dehydratase [Brevibacillus borstelensis]|uniref:GDP-mannose 4,6-dehydratase n=1 Tax=Brevibacillus borstelensis TaxID=45462 RepID=UPI0030C0C77D